MSRKNLACRTCWTRGLNGGPYEETILGVSLNCSLYGVLATDNDDDDDAEICRARPK